MKNLEIIKILRKKVNTISSIFTSYKFDKSIIKSNKTVITLFSLTFIYLCYLSIPALNNETIIQEKIKRELAKVFDSDFIEFEDYNYTFFPKPNFSLKNVSILQKEDKDSEIAKIKKIKFIISQKKLYKKNDFDLQKILIYGANFSVSKNNIKNYKKLFYSIINKRITVTNSKIFFKDNNLAYAIIVANKINLFFDKKKNHNTVKLTGNVFNLPIKLNYNINFYKKENFLKINFGKIKLLFENNSRNTDHYSSVNQIKFLNSKLVNKINNKKDQNIFEIKSENSKINQSNIIYNGLVKINPLYFNFDFKINEVNLTKIIFLNSFFESLFTNLLMENEFLNGNIVINLKDIKKSKLINEGKIQIKIQRGEFDFSGSEFIIKNIGKVKILSSRLLNNNNKTSLQTYLNFFINDKDRLYKKFLISKKNRINLKEIFCALEIIPNRKEFIVSDIEINHKSYQDTNYIISSFQDLRKSLNELLINYDG